MAFNMEKKLTENEMAKIVTASLFDVLIENHPNCLNKQDALLVLLARYHQMINNNEVSFEQFGETVKILLDEFYLYNSNKKTKGII